MNYIKLREKQGIALVIVLGFLSIMLILAVAFAITMRTERLAARNHLDVIKTRFLMQVALARTFDAIDQEIGNKMLLWGAYPSLGGSSAPSLLDGSALDYIPGSLRGFAQSANSSVTWTNIVVDSTNIGRFAFLAVDCSGLLDASVIGKSGTARGYGSGPREMQIDSTTILPEISSASTFFAGRTVFKRFETLPELGQLGRDGGFMPAGTPTHLFIYSRFPQGQYMVGANVSNAVYIGGSESGVINTQGEIEAQFASMGLSASDAEMTAWNFIDYIDSNLDAAHGALALNTFCTEPVPMLNEIVFSNRIDASSDGVTNYYTNNLSVSVEVWYPFVGYVNPNNYSVSLRLASQGGNFAFQINPAVEYPLASADWDDSNQRFRTISTTSADLPASRYSVAVGGNVTFPSYRMDIGVVDADHVDVDRINNIPMPTVPVLVGAVTLPPGISVCHTSAVYVKEANDPRINWLWLDSLHWAVAVTNGHSLGSMNPSVSNAVNGFTAPGADGAWMMYVRNTDQLTNVGELGLLLYSATQPWHTIKLLDPGALPVLDRFTTAINPIARGLVNPNTLSTNALATALMSCPTNRWPGEAVSNGLTAPQSMAIAQRIIEATGFSNPFTNVADIARVGEVGIEAAIPSTFDQMQKEGIVRNTAGLLSTRQNLFTIILLVQAMGAGETTAEQKALVVVWRDPFPNSAGRHPMFVRYFRWLTDKCE